jgi:hypothetical protein
VVEDKTKGPAKGAAKGPAKGEANTAQDEKFKILNELPN